MTALYALEHTNDLPDVTTFAPFQSLSHDGKTIQDPAPSACVVCEFVFSKSRWATFPNNSGTQLINQSSTTGEMSPSGPPDWTLAEILSENIQNWPCALCGKKGETCLGDECTQGFRQNSQDTLESLEIRHGDDEQYGVYCKGDAFIPTGSILGEYIGEVLPPNTDVNEVLKNDPYGFGISGVGYVTAKTYGNWTRFVNHTCIQYNVMTRRVMYGRRLVMAFIAKTDIHPGDQLHSNYGRQYFLNMTSHCMCNDWDKNGAPHLPPSPQELKAAGRASEPVPEVINTLANMRQLRATPGDVDTTQPRAFNESRTFEIDFSAGGNFVMTKEFTIPRSVLMGARNGKTIDIDLVVRRRDGGGISKSHSAVAAKTSAQKPFSRTAPTTSAIRPGK